MLERSEPGGTCAQACKKYSTALAIYRFEFGILDRTGLKVNWWAGPMDPAYTITIQIQSIVSVQLLISKSHIYSKKRLEYADVMCFYTFF